MCSLSAVNLTLDMTFKCAGTNVQGDNVIALMSVSVSVSGCVHEQKC